MDISENLKGMKQVTFKYGETKYALGRALAHNEMLNALATYMDTYLLNEREVKALEQFQRIIRDDLEIEESNVQTLMNELDELLR